MNILEEGYIGFDEFSLKSNYGEEAKTTIATSTFTESSSSIKTISISSETSMELTTTGPKDINKKNNLKIILLSTLLPLGFIVLLSLIFILFIKKNSIKKSSQINNTNLNEDFDMNIIDNNPSNLNREQYKIESQEINRKNSSISRSISSSRSEIDEVETMF